MKSKDIQHLYWRIGFGILPDDLKVLSKKKKKEVVEDLIKASKKITPLKLDISELKKLMNNKGKVDKEVKREILKISRAKIKELNIAWVERLSNTDEVLREKMTLFWANHFVCQDNNYIYTEKFHNTLREHALGNFKDFVIAISKEAAMTKYLNTKQNKKQKPNENFARELMELFTLGVGNYTETDIKESAKAFTGYSHNKQGEFVLKQRVHDEGNKTFFGKTGNFNGEDIIGIILEEEQCAKYICEKIYRYFVNDIIDANHVNDMVKTFYPNYDISELMHFVLMADWFYDEKNIGTKIKSPIELLVGIKNVVPMEFKKANRLLYLQKVLGQILFKPPNVAGWKGGRAWIDSNTIVLRLKLPSVLLNEAYISKIEKGKSDNNVETKKESYKNKFKRLSQTQTDWVAFNRRFKNVEIDNLGDHLLACDMNPQAVSYLNSLEKVSKQEYCIQIMSLPEYQMC